MQSVGVGNTLACGEHNAIGVGNTLAGPLHRSRGNAYS